VKLVKIGNKYINLVQEEPTMHFKVNDLHVETITFERVDEEQAQFVGIKVDAAVDLGHGRWMPFTGYLTRDERADLLAVIDGATKRIWQDMVAAIDEARRAEGASG
jgi:hypothetical protein